MAVLGYLYIAVVLVLVAGIEASPVRETESPKESFLRRVLNRMGLKPEPRDSRDTDLIRDLRQMECTMNSDCFPPQFTVVPTVLIECSSGQCLCRECFTFVNGTCAVDSCPDYFYNQPSQMCVDDRPSQLAAFLLSFFLSATGAANFHIDRDDLAAAQLVILLVFLISSYTLCYIPCCLACCGTDKENVKGTGLFVCTICLVVLLIVALFLVIWAWWIADLVIFARNDREAGNGCTLSPDL